MTSKSISNWAISFRLLSQLLERIKYGGLLVAAASSSSSIHTHLGECLGQSTAFTSHHINFISFRAGNSDAHWTPVRYHHPLHTLILFINKLLLFFFVKCDLETRCTHSLSLYLSYTNTYTQHVLPFGHMHVVPANLKFFFFSQSLSRCFLVYLYYKTRNADVRTGLLLCMCKTCWANITSIK